VDEPVMLRSNFMIMTTSCHYFGFFHEISWKYEHESIHTSFVNHFHVVIVSCMNFTPEVGPFTLHSHVVFLSWFHHFSCHDKSTSGLYFFKIMKWNEGAVFQNSWRILSISDSFVGCWCWLCVVVCVVELSTFDFVINKLPEIFIIYLINTWKSFDPLNFWLLLYWLCVRVVFDFVINNLYLFIEIPEDNPSVPFLITFCWLVGCVRVGLCDKQINYYLKSYLLPDILTWKSFDHRSLINIVSPYIFLRQKMGRLYSVLATWTYGPNLLP